GSRWPTGPPASSPETRTCRGMRPSSDGSTSGASPASTSIARRRSASPGAGSHRRPAAAGRDPRSAAPPCPDRAAAGAGHPSASRAVASPVASPAAAAAADSESPLAVPPDQAECPARPSQEIPLLALEAVRRRRNGAPFRLPDPGRLCQRCRLTQEEDVAHGVRDVRPLIVRVVPLVALVDVPAVAAPEHLLQIGNQLDAAGCHLKPHGG